MSIPVVEHDPAGEARARLDSTVLPTATSWRFTLLIVTAAAGALYLNDFVLEVLVQVFGSVPLLSNRGCFQRLLAAVRAGRPGYALTFNACTTTVQVRSGAAVLASVVLLALATVGIYRLCPRLILRAVAARPLADLAGVVPDHVLNLVHEQVAQIGRPVDVLVAVNHPTTGGRAFGCFPRYRILLDMGLVAGADQDEGRLRAVLAHEVAHLRNRDIDITYLAMSVWWAFLLVEVPPFLMAGARYPQVLLALCWRVVLLLAMIWFVRASVLRTREFYADLSADGQLTAGDPLKEVLLARASTERTGALARIARAVSYHPTARARLAVLADMSPLFRLWPIDCLIVGVLVGLSYSPLELIIDLLGTPYAWRDVVLGCLFGALAAGSLAATLWRQTYQQLNTGQRPHGIWWGAAAFGTGIVAGQLVTPPLSAVNGLSDLLRRLPLQGAVLIAVLYLICYGLFRWIVLCAAGWLPAAKSPRWAYRVGGAVAVIVGGAWVSYWFRTQTLLLRGATPWRMLELVGSAIAVIPFLNASLAVALAYSAAAWCHVRLRRSLDASRRTVLVPVPTALVVALVIIIAATFVPLGFQGAIRAAAAAGARSGVSGTTGRWSMPIFTVTLQMFVAISAVAGLGTGLIRGGRVAMTPLIASAGLATLIAAPFALLLTFFHFFHTASGSWTRALVAMGMLPSDTLFNGTLLGIWFVSLAGACMMGAAIGAGVRRTAQLIRGAPPPSARCPWDVGRCAGLPPCCQCYSPAPPSSSLPSR